MPSFSIYVLCKHLKLPNICFVFHISDDTNSNIINSDIVLMAGLLAGICLFAIFIMTYSIKHKCTCNVFESHESTGSVRHLEPSNNSQHISNDTDEHLFIPLITSNEDEHKQGEKDELI